MVIKYDTMIDYGYWMLSLVTFLYSFNFRMLSRRYLSQPVVDVLSACIHGDPHACWLVTRELVVSQRERRLFPWSSSSGSKCVSQSVQSAYDPSSKPNNLCYYLVGGSSVLVLHHALCTYILYIYFMQEIARKRMQSRKSWSSCSNYIS